MSEPTVRYVVERWLFTHWDEEHACHTEERAQNIRHASVANGWPADQVRVAKVTITREVLP